MIMKKESYFIVLIFFISSFLFINLTNKEILNPFNTLWLLDGDSAGHYIAFQFFRYTPFIQWPIGANPAYGMEISNSIVFTDSVSFLAIFFKILSPFLPNNIQYSGLWLFICCLLQQLIAFKIFRNIGFSKFLSFLSSNFFILAPPFLFRLEYHYALFAHWVVLLAIYLYLNHSFNNSKWVFLLLLSLTIEPYLFAMVAPLFLADISKRYSLNLINRNQFLKLLLFNFFILLFAAWSLGYFMISDGAGGVGFGYLKANILTFFDPNVINNQIWSSTMPDIQGGGGDYEGMAFLGIGIILLLLICSIVLILNPGDFKNQFLKKHNLPLLFVLLILFLYALSNQIAFGDSVILEYPNFFPLNMVSEKFRSSGRFIWPVFYFLYFFIIYVIHFFLKTRFTVFFILLALTIQVLDSYKVFIYYKDKYRELVKNELSLKSNLWIEFPKIYKNLIYVALPRNGYINWMDLSYYAGKHQMKTNAAHMGRTDINKIAFLSNNIERSVINDNLQEDSLYIFDDDLLWNVITTRKTQNDLLGVIDGYRVFAPNFFKCNYCAKFSDDIKNFHNSEAYKLPQDNLIDFSDNNPSNFYKVFGWSNPDKDGSWVLGNEAFLYFEIPDKSKPIFLKIDALPYKPAGVDYQDIEIYINDKYIEKKRFNNSSFGNYYSLKIPTNIIRPLKGKLLISFKAVNPISPLNAGEHNDKRNHSIKIKSIYISNNE